MTDAPPVSSELKSMVNNGSNTGSASPVNKILAVATAALSAVVVCLSVAVARTSDNDTVVQTVEMLTMPTVGPPPGDNICKGTKVPLDNIKCVIDQVEMTNVDGTRFALGTAEQSGVNVTLGYQGSLDVDTVPITGPYFESGLCPVNVHWHLGAEHYSVGEYDLVDNGPGDHDHRALAGEARPGFKCHHYDDTDSKFTKEYEWKHCVDTHVGETYEVHWPHSNMGACATLNQYQTPFYDGVFCRFATDYAQDLSKAKIGVQGQVFTIVNDEAYYYPDLIRGMIVDGDIGSDIATYTGSTTGTSRDNDMCSQYTGITWQVDRKCHLISASSFDKMCADMKAQRDDMKDDLYPHGSRELVADHLAADNHQRKLLRAN